MDFRKFLDYIAIRTKDGKVVRPNESEKKMMYGRYKSIKKLLNLKYTPNGREEVRPK